MAQVPATSVFLLAAFILGCSGPRSERVSRDESIPTAPEVETDSARTHRHPSERTEPVSEAPEPGIGVVAFQLDLPHGARGGVEVLRTLRRDPSAEIQSRATWDTSIRRDGADAVLEADALTLEVTPSRMAADWVNSVLVLGSFLPTCRINRDFELDLTETERTLEQLASAVEVIPSRVRDAPSFAVARPVLSDEAVIRRNASSIWQSLAIPPGELTLGERWEAEAPSTLSIGGRELPQRTTFIVVARTSCFEGDAPDRCAWLDARVEFDSAELNRLAQGLGIEALRIEQRSTLLTEVRTLLPHRRWTRTERWSSVVAGGRPVSVHEVEETTLAFRWQRDSIRRVANDRGSAQR